VRLHIVSLFCLLQAVWQGSAPATAAKPAPPRPVRTGLPAAREPRNARREVVSVSGVTVHWFFDSPYTLIEFSLIRAIVAMQSIFWNKVAGIRRFM